MKKIISLILALLMVFSLCACKSQGENGEIETIVDNFFKSIQKYDMKEFDSFFYDTDEIKAAKIIDSRTPQYSYLKEKAKEMTYKIQNVKINSSEAEVEVLCSYYDMTSVYSTMMLKAFELVSDGADISVTGEEFDKLVKKAFDQALASNPPKKENKEITLTLNNKDGKWYIKGSIEIADVVTGNLAKTLSGLAKEN